MSTGRMRQSSVNKVRARAEALAQPMPEHELANVDLDTHTVISGTASRALIVAVGVAVLISVALFACQRQAPDDGAGATGADMLVATGAANGTAAPNGTNGTGQATSSDGNQPDQSTENQEVVVSVQGMVHRPGLLRVQSSTRVGEAIEAAGGGLPKAVVLGINLAEPVSDGMQIVVDDRGSRVVYAGGEPAAPGGAASKGTGSPGAAGNTGGTDSTGSAEGKVNLNTADATQLETISGIGPATAEAIIAWRDSNGPFTSVEQLMEVRGIGPAKFEAMRDAVTV
ncbi:helix-hairpin-helix domain-containing protein [Corynebacterium sp. YSMAA1_1_F7]|uniref:helix-hairpin-helix domain-containing protein n=1 Tax=Corynebacterium sp. YSMAA1_1_F7 TaxID=3383590 RepID=UPI0038CF7B4C